ncbi:DinB family protein [Mycolicibacterium flavescens]|uniref:Mini-circle protein n=1 Tax=Mycolicibacterium flavescens TaxID=1776 RepID=A0A1E3RG39_MYCFV|nr:DinB family protein [Mycolicibacterium flavescens]MCV7282823.1 DinB family protein [Mycolicibacterium flavescens]ODQ88823.1 Mini-circle protein [Mycolicibacterium flavescens]
MPPLDADERTALEAWLDFYRATLAMKCAGLDDVELSTTSIDPSPLTLHGLVQHMAEVERKWFRRVLAGEAVPSIYGAPDDTTGHDGGFALSEHSTFAEAQSIWQREVTAARAACAGRDLDDTSPFPGGGQVSVRWVYLHMITEYARHCGHADMIRERLDGTTGV